MDNIVNSFIVQNTKFDTLKAEILTYGVLPGKKVEICWPFFINLI